MRVGAAVLLALCAILLGWIGYANPSNPDFSEDLRIQNQKLIAQVDSLQSLLSESALQEHNGRFWYDMAMRAQMNQGILLSGVDESALKRLGLQNPADDIRRSLMEDEAVLRPYDRDLRMRFLPQRIAILSTHWVYAEFENGHMGGECLLEFKVVDGAVAGWRILQCTLPPREQ